MANSDSDSDYFESADENLSDNESNEKKIDNPQQCFAAERESDKDDSLESESLNTLSTESSQEFTEDAATPPSPTKQFRKRPERNKRTQIKDEREHVNPTASEDLPKPEMILQDVTYQISKNLSLGLNTFRQTSSSIREIVKSSIPLAAAVEPIREIVKNTVPLTAVEPIKNIVKQALPIKADSLEDKFIYDDDRNELEDGACSLDPEMSETPVKSTLNDMIMSLSHEFDMLQQITDRIAVGVEEGESEEMLPEKMADAEVLKPIEKHTEQQSDSENEDISVNSDNEDDTAKEITAEGNIEKISPTPIQNQEDTFINVKLDQNTETDKENIKEIQDETLRIKTADEEAITEESGWDDFDVDVPEEDEKTQVDVDLGKKDVSQIFPTKESTQAFDVDILSNNSEKHMDAAEQISELEVGLETGWDVDVDVVHKKDGEPKEIKKIAEGKEAAASGWDDFKEEIEENKQVHRENSQETPEEGGWDDFDFEIEEASKHEIQKGHNDADIKDTIKCTAEKVKEASDDSNGWENFDVEVQEIQGKSEKIQTSNTGKSSINMEQKKESSDNDSNGWGDFDMDDDAPEVDNKDKNKLSSWDDWGEEDVSPIKKEGDPKWSGWEKFGQSEEEKKQTWGFGGWGVNSILTKATAVTQGISSVLEAGLGAPNPEDLARLHKKEEEEYMKKLPQSSTSSSENRYTTEEDTINQASGFGLTNLVAGVTSKIVEHTRVQEIGSKVITGGLDTLESIGKKTMQVLQEGDPGLKRKKALLLGDGDKPVLSQILREAKEKAETEGKRIEEKQVAKKCHFETLFDDFQGLIHLEALEMLSRQCELKLDQLKKSMKPSEVEDFLGVIQEVKELCEIDEDEFETSAAAITEFKESLESAIEPLKREISIKKIFEVHDGVEEWFEAKHYETSNVQVVYQKAISAMAELTAATAQQFHKVGELLLVKERRKTVEEADTLLQFTSSLCYEINRIAEKYATVILKSGAVGNSDVSVMVTNIHVEAGNAVCYIKQAFDLLVPVVQLGAT